MSNFIFANTNIDAFHGDVIEDPSIGVSAQKKAAKTGFTVHIRSQQRNGRKSLTTIAGLEDDLDYKKILKVMRKLFSTNGTILKDEETGGSVIQLQGDRRADAMEFLYKYKVCDKSEIKVHGF